MNPKKSVYLNYLLSKRGVDKSIISKAIATKGKVSIFQEEVLFAKTNYSSILERLDLRRLQNGGKAEDKLYFGNKVMSAVNITFEGSLDNEHRSYYSFSNCKFRKVCFIYADLSNVSFINSVFRNVNFDRANLQRAKFIKCTFINCSFKQSNLKHAYLVDLNLEDTNFVEANLSHTDLSHTNLTGVNLCKANLTKANLDNAILKKANLSNAILLKIKNWNTIEIAFVNLIRTFHAPKKFIAWAIDNGAFIDANKLLSYNDFEPAG